MQTISTRSTQDVADRLYELAQQNKWEQALDELFSDDAANQEPSHVPDWQNVQGREKIREKMHQFHALIEQEHNSFVHPPLVTGKYIALSSGKDVTMKGRGRVQLSEITLYEVKDGQIVKEQFFY